MSEIKPCLSSLHPTQENIIELGRAIYAQRPVRMISQALAEEFGGKIGDPIPLEALLSKPGGWSSCFDDAFRALTAISASDVCASVQKERDELRNFMEEAKRLLGQISKSDWASIDEMKGIGIELGPESTAFAREIDAFLARYEGGR